MTAGRYDMVVEIGATFTRTFVWKVDDTPVNLTGYTARAQIRSTVNTLGDPLVELTTDPSGGIALGGILGTILLTISATVTEALVAMTDASWDLELISAGGVVTRLLQGKVEIRGNVTR